MRRLFCDSLSIGRIVLGDLQSHHARAVLRLTHGDTVELFDSAGHTARAIIDQLEPAVALLVESVEKSVAGACIWVAAAVPKGDRADWMVEKLSELGVARWVPLRTARSVVHPDGASKFDRWRRIATESAKQSHRSGLMEIAPLTELETFLIDIDPTNAYTLSLNPNSPGIHQIQNTKYKTQNTKHPLITLIIGPEGGWTIEEESTMRDRGLTSVSLGRTILRIETAAVVAAGIVAVITQTQLPKTDLL